MRSTILATLALAFSTAFAFADPILVSHQGTLSSNGSPITGNVDLRFTLFDASSAGNVVEGPVTVVSVPVAGGLFTAQVPLDSGSFDGSDRWFEIEAADAGTGSWFTLSPRHRVTTTPEAAHAHHADSADNATYALYAFDGPFAPVEPITSSGLRGTASTTTTLEFNGQGIDPVQLHGSIVMGFPYTTLHGSGDPMPSSSFPSYLATVRRNVGSNYQVDWRDEYPGPLSPLRLEIVTHESDYGTTIWTFELGVIVDYQQVSGTSEGAYEELTIMFPGTQNGPYSAAREFQAASQQVTPPKAPTLGRATVPMGGPPGGLLQAKWNTQDIEYETVDTALNVGTAYSLISGSISGGYEYKTCTFRRSVLGDNSLFDDFEQARPRTFEVEMIQGHAVIDQPMNANGLIVAVEIFFADDGYLVEDYEIAVGNVRP